MPSQALGARKKIILLRPKPYDNVGGSFIICGWVLKSFIFFGPGVDNTIFLDILGIDGNNWRSGQDINVKINFLSIFKKKFWFTTRFQFYTSDIPWIKQSQGRVLLRLGTRQNSKILFIPIVVKELEPANGADPEIIQRHGKLSEIIEQYEIDLENWNKEMDEIRQSNPYKINVTENDEWMTSVDIKDDDLLKHLIRILSSSEDEFEEKYKIAKQAQEEKALAEKYKDAIEWRGPLFRGTVHRWRGFIIKVHSDDHGNHFHVIHKERGIDARFSFPEIELIDYKRSRKTIKSKEETAIYNLLKNKEIFEKLKKEFDKMLSSRGCPVIRKK